MNKVRISIKNKIKSVVMRMVIFLIVTTALNMISSYMFSLRYDQIITNVEYANQLKNIVETQIYNDTWNIVSGTTAFEEGNQYEHIQEIYEGISYLTLHTTLGVNSTELEVAKRTTDTLEKYVDKLGVEMSADARVDETLHIYDEIRNVSILVGDLLQEFIFYEITNAAKLNKVMQMTQNGILLADFFAIMAFIWMVTKTQKELTRSINEPIRELESMAGMIATGDFKARVENSGVLELESLTKSLNSMAIKIEELIDENNKEHNNLKKAELNLLQAQIKPHFLYNTYDTIIWLAEKNSVEEIIQVVEALTTFYRVALSKGDDWINVANEVKHVESYLIIQRFRYGSILEYTIDIDEDIFKNKMLKLLLQPIVENAIYHGIKYLRGKGSLSIRGYKKDGYIVFEVEDTGIGMDQETLNLLQERMYKEYDQDYVVNEQAGYGLNNVHWRIRLYYGSECGVTISSEKGRGTTVVIKLTEEMKNMKEGMLHV